MVLLLVGVAAVQWFVGPWHGSIRPDAGVAEAFFVVKGITLAWVAAVIMRSIGWAACGFRRPVRPSSFFYGTPILLLGASALSAGVPPTMTPPAFVSMAGWVAIGVLFEEIIFRGVMWEAVAKRGHFFTAITTSVGFGMIHTLGFGSELVPNSVVAAQVVFAMGTGVVIAAVRIAAGTIWTAVAVHWVFNMLSFVASGGVSETLSPGMEIQILSAGVVLGLVGLGLVWLAARRSQSPGEAGGVVNAGMAAA